MNVPKIANETENEYITRIKDMKIWRARAGFKGHPIHFTTYFNKVIELQRDSKIDVKDDLIPIFEQMLEVNGLKDDG